jgi:hypothetical protein
MKRKFNFRSFKIVKNIIEGYEDEKILNDFLEEFNNKKRINYKEFIDFNMKYVNGGCDEEFYINWNWNN